MLVLSRRISEAIYIGNDVTVTLVAIEGNQVKIGIDAPKSTANHRDNAKNLRAESCKQLR